MYSYRLKKNLCPELRVFIILIIFNAFSGNLSADQGQDLLESFEKLHQQMSQSLDERNQQIDNGSFSKASVTTAEILDQVDLLIEAFMPLNERIQKLIEKESLLVEETGKALNSIGVQKQKFQDDLIVKQIKNRETTEAVAKLTTKQLRSEHDSKSDSSKQPKVSEQNAVLKEVGQLLTDSADLQTGAIDSLEEASFQMAYEREQDALEKLEEALDKLKQNSSSKQQQSKNQKEQKKNSSSEKQSQQQQSRESAQQSKNQNRQESLEEKNKMSPEEALKKLIKLRKQAEDEKKRREKQYAAPQEQQRVPVDKDW